MTGGEHRAANGGVRAIALHDHVGLDMAERSALEVAIQPLRTLADVLAWSRVQAPPLSVVEIVTQDEYTHDVVLASDGRPYLAFDTT
jgi:hypothetical protein